MHSEWGLIDAPTADHLNQIRSRDGRIVAAGTTVLRLLESAATESNRIKPFEGTTDIFITPGYRFRGVDILQTNFHLPPIDTFYVGSCLFRSRKDEGCLFTRNQQRLPILFLW